MDAESVISSNEMLGGVLVAVLVALWARNRAFAREISDDQDHGWRAMLRAAVMSAGVLVLWASVFDNWRQMTAIPWRLTDRYPSQLRQIDPPSSDVRAVTFMLLAVLLVFAACLIARHVGGYFLQAILAVAAFVAWLPFFIIRQRFTLNLAMGFDGSWRSSPSDVAAYLGFAVISWAVDIGLIAVSFVFLVALMALPVTLALDIMRLRRPRVTGESQSFFNAIGSRAAR